MRHTPSSLRTLTQPGGRGSLPNDIIAVIIRFLTGLSSRFMSFSAREVIARLYINLSGVPHFFDHLQKRAARLASALAGDPGKMQVFHHLLEFPYWDYDGSSVAFIVGNVLDVLKYQLLIPFCLHM